MARLSAGQRLVVDVGTTTVSLAAVDVNTGRVVRRTEMLNPQLRFGYDVISRIARAEEVFRAGLVELIDRVRRGWQIDNRRTVTAVGNTVMAHFLLGRSPAGLGAHPYRSALPVRQVLTVSRSAGSVRLRFQMLPLLGRFVGSDCCAAILAVGMHRSHRLSLLVDAGTNGEVVLGNCERMLVCSTAAGPAFEGATLKCGSIVSPGAVIDVKVSDGTVQLVTMGGKAPTGICGSGVIAAVAAGLKLGLIEENGRLCEGQRMALGEGLYLSQQDLREVQLAKAAIAAGIKVLLKISGVSVSEIERVFLTGRFGRGTDWRAAQRIGLLPQTGARAWQHSNLALRGAMMAAGDRRELAAACQLARRCREIMLSGRPDFEQEFIAAMEFAPWP